MREALTATLLAGIVAAGPIQAQTITEGVELEVVYTADITANVAGGLDQGARYLDNLDLTVSINGDAFGWRGGGILLYGIGNQGGNITSLVGDAQVVNNIEAPNDWHLYEAWVEQTLGDRVSILGGLYDLNSEFDVNRTGALFLNSSHGIGIDISQSGLNGPSIFPVTSLGARARVALTSSLEIRGAVLDGVPGDPDRHGGTSIKLGSDDGLLLAGEVEFIANGDHEREPIVNVPRRMVGPISSRARIVAGGWTYTHEFERIADPGRTSHSRGAYLLAEWCPYREANDRSQGLSTFLRVGMANEEVNRFSRYAGMGLVYTGLLEGRGSDKLGVAVAVAVNGDPYISSMESSPATSTITRAETNLEATYAAHIAPWLSAQVDVQYVIDPNTWDDVPDALVPTLRLVVSP